MAGFTIDRNCDITAKCIIETDYKDIEQAQENLKESLDKFQEFLADAHSKDECIDNVYVYADVTNVFEEDGRNFNEITVEYSYTEECQCYEGHESRDWYEPDEPTDIEALEDGEQRAEMRGDIREAFDKIDIDCLEVDITDDRIDSLESLFEAAEEHQSGWDIEPDYDDR